MLSGSFNSMVSFRVLRRVGGDAIALDTLKNKHVSLFVAKRGVFFIRCTLSQNKNTNMWGRLMLLQFCPKHQRPTLKPLRSLRRDVRFCRIQARIDRIRLPIFTEK
jgi:hypothetical protein